MIRIELPDGASYELPSGISILEAAGTVDPGLGDKAVCATVSGVLCDLRDRLEGDCALSIHTESAPEGLAVLRHSTAHIVAQAARRLFPHAMMGKGGDSQQGFYYDLETAQGVGPEDLLRIEAVARQIIEEDLPIERIEMSKGDARTWLIRQGEALKLELLEELAVKTVTFYRQGEHIDLCHGPHVMSTGCVPAVHLTDLAPVHWRADPFAEALQRIHGTVTCLA
jgi:threonyl-tRNA synthetase